MSYIQFSLHENFQTFVRDRRYFETDNTSRHVYVNFVHIVISKAKKIVLNEWFTFSNVQKCAIFIPKHVSSSVFKDIQLSKFHLLINCISYTFTEST